LLRIVELLHTHLTPTLPHAVFGGVRRSERQRVWTLDALVRFWTAVVLRALTASTPWSNSGREISTGAIHGRISAWPGLTAGGPACRWRRFTSNIALTTAGTAGSVPRGAPGSSLLICAVAVGSPGYLSGGKAEGRLAPPWLASDVTETGWTM
jgi:hypothetical protein